MRTNQNTEPSAEIHEIFELTSDRERRIWAESGCDYVYFVVRFLQGKRRLEIQPEEIVLTKLYRRSDDLERRALRMVCDSGCVQVPSPEDSRRLREMDNWLYEYLEHRNIGHADKVKMLQSIPAHVMERQRFDSTYFATLYTSPKLFGFLWEAR